VAGLPCNAGEVAVLKNGFSIRHERREIVGNVTRLYVSADGSSFVDVPMAEIEHFEAAADLPGSRLPAGKAPQSPLLANYTRNGAPVAAVFPKTSVVDLNKVVNSASGRYRLDP